MKIPKRKKKDFKLNENIVIEFEKLAPNGKQTQIVEKLIENWVQQQKIELRQEEVKKAYEREKRR